MLVRRRCLEAVGAFDATLPVFGCEDWDLWLRLARRYAIVAVDEELVRYRVHEANTRPEQVMASGLAVLDRLYADPGVEREAGIAAGFEAEGELDGVPDDVQLVTYRVAQEAVTNVIQHADAGHLRVRLIGAADGAIELRVSDDGAGYAGGRSKERLGIAGMRERALLCGGELTVESEPGAGTRVTLQA